MELAAEESPDFLLPILKSSKVLSTKAIAEKARLSIDDARHLLGLLQNKQLIGRKHIDGVESWHMIDGRVPELEAAEVQKLPVKLAPSLPKFFFVKDLMMLRSRRELNLRPYFQRDVVWKLQAKGYLVESILQGYPVPEVFVHRNKETNALDVLDGQQRLTSIFEYAEGAFELSALGGYDALPPDLKKRFLEYPIAVREVEGLSDETIREVFRRLNTNVIPLSAQELRHARFSGPFIRMVEELAADPWWLKQGVVTEEQHRRMRAAEFVSLLVVCMKEEVQDGLYHLTDYYEAYESGMQQKEADAWKSRILNLLSSFRAMMRDVKGTGWQKREDVLALVIALDRLSKNKLRLTPERYSDAGASLHAFRDKVTKERSEPRGEANVRLYLDTISGGIGARDKRELRISILYNMLVPYCKVSAKKK